jgi:hypothetical protein
VSPRRHHRAEADVAPLDEGRARRGVERLHAARDGDWLVRSIPGDASTKAYRCPGCDQEIPPGVAHVVAWPTDGRGDLTDRRHWHTACWRARDNRAPRIIRRR